LTLQYDFGLYRDLSILQVRSDMSASHELTP
jgi:hypothetical protein